MKKQIKLLLWVILTVFILSGCSSDIEKRKVKQDTEEIKKIKIGFSMDTLKEERWQSDREIFVAKAKELDADVIVQNANNDNDEQANQVKYLLEQGIDVLVIIPHDADKAASMVQTARKSGVKVIAYDRMVKNANVDAYVSFDSIRVGMDIADHMVKRVPEGNYVIINGAKTDYNSFLINQGVKKILKPLRDKRDIRVISEIWAEDWMPEEAFKCIEKTLQSGERIDAVIAANDSLAGAAIEALAEQRLATKVPVAGHDADLAGCQRVVEGTQSMTVYKPIQNIAQKAAEIAVSMAKGEKIEFNSSIRDGKYEVPYYMIEPIAVTKENMMKTVIQDGFHTEDDVYHNIPKTLRP